MFRLVIRPIWQPVAISLILCCMPAARVTAQSPGSAQPAASGTGLQHQLDALEDEARSDYAKADYDSAAQEFERLVSLKPNYAGTWNDLGICYHFLGRLPQAVQTLQKALQLNPDILSANLILGIDEIQLNNSEKAIPVLQRALRIDPTNRDAAFALASAQIALQKFDQAAEIYKREVDLRPVDADAWYGLGLCFEHLAEDTTRRMTRFGKESPYTQAMIGEYLTEQGASIDAEQAFAHALASSTDQEGLHASLGFAHLRAGDLVQADQEFNAEQQINPANLDVRLGLADVAMERDHFDQARRLLCEVYGTDNAYFDLRLNFTLSSLDSQTQSKAVDELSPGNFPNDCAPALEAAQGSLTSPQSTELLKHAFESSPTSRKRSSVDPSALAAAQIARKAGRYSVCFQAMENILAAGKSDTLLFAHCACLSGHLFRGFEAARSILERDPQSMPALYWQAESARKLAQAAFQQSMNLRPDSWQAHVLLGDIFRQRKQWDQAVSHYKDAARLKPASPAPFLGLGTVYWQIGQNAEAEGALSEALKVQPDNPLADFELGDIYVREHRFVEAASLLQKGIARNPERLSAHADLGKSYASLGRKKEAIAELQHAQAIDRFGDIHYQLYRLYKEQGDTRLSEEALAESERLRAHELQRHGERTKRAADIQVQGDRPSVEQP